MSHCQQRMAAFTDLLGQYGPVEYSLTCWDNMAQWSAVLLHWSTSLHLAPFFTRYWRRVGSPCVWGACTCVHECGCVITLIKLLGFRQPGVHNSAPETTHTCKDKIQQQFKDSCLAPNYSTSGVSSLWWAPNYSTSGVSSLWWALLTNLAHPYQITFAAAVNRADLPHWSLRVSRARLPWATSCFTHFKLPPHTAQWSGERPCLSHRVTSARCLSSTLAVVSSPLTQALMRAVTPVRPCCSSTTAQRWGWKE